MIDPHDRLVVALPRLVGTRSAARAFVSEAGDFTGRVVEVDGTGLASGPQSFADELIVGLLVEGDAAGLVVRGAPADFSRYVTDAARARAVADLVSVL